MKIRDKYLLAVLFLSVISFFANIWGTSIYSLDEAKNSVAAREMLQRSDFIVPTFNYELRTDKPPMHYYFMILAYKVFGFNEFSARFFSSLFGVLTVLITFLFSKRFFNQKIAFLSAVVLLASLHFSIQFHMAVPDPYLIFFINASLFSFYLFYKENKVLYLYLFYVFMAFGVLTKGPVAVVLPSFTVFLFMLITHHLNLNFLKKLKLFTGLFIVLVISLPWYIAVGIKTNWVWVEDFILKHNLHRFSDSMEGHGGIFLVTFLYVFAGLLPFSVFILQSIKNGLERKYKDVNIFLLIFSLIYVGFFAISSTKLPNYTVPAYPPIAILTGSYLYRLKYSKSVKFSLYTFIVLTVFLSFGAYFGLKHEPPLKDIAYLSFSFLFLTIVGIVSLILIRKSTKNTIFTLFSGNFIFILLFFYIIFPQIDKRNPVVRSLPLLKESKNIYYYQGFNPAFAFYIKTPIREVKDFNRIPENSLIITRKRYLKDINLKNLKIIFQQKDLFENKYTVILKKI
jgi:4-amino-4-deoxy-L-arabinose transferase-like glycosyltransferase